MKNKRSATVVLTLIAIVAALLLGVTNEITKGPILEQKMKDEESARKLLLPDADAFEAIELSENADIDTCFVGKKEGEPVGYVAQINVKGFGGPIEVTVGTDTLGTVTGIEVGGTEFSETAGLGAKAKEDAFKKQFAGVTTPIAVGEQIDAITAATITSNAIVRGVNAAVGSIGEIAGFAIAQNVEGGALGNGRYSATVEGFAGPVYVEVQLDEANVITEIIIGDERFSETPGFGQKAQEAAFYTQFVGLASPIEFSDIDAISGATITSKAVVEAVNRACLYVTDPEAAQAAVAAPSVEEIVLSIPDDARFANASAEGFEGPVYVEIALDETDQIVSLTIGDDRFCETKGLGANAREPEFIKQFIGKSLPVSLDDIDTISGATITTKAVIQAINEAAGQLIEIPAATALPVEQGMEIAQDKAPQKAAETEGQVASASAEGFAGPVFVEVMIDSDNAVQAIQIGDDNFAETKGFGASAKDPEFMNQFIGKTLPIAIEDIDALSGATITTKAVISAINEAFEKSKESTAPQEVGIEAETEGQVASASAEGFAGPVFVEVMIGSDNAIQAIQIGDDNFAETKGFGASAKEPEFMNQFIGKTLPIAIEDIDALSGATITTKAIISAINEAFEKSKESTTPQEVGIEAETEGQVASASAEGFAGPVFVEVMIDSDNAIQAIQIGDDNFAETKGFGASAKDPEFMNQFIGKTLPIAIEDIDALSGATITSKAVISAINEAFEKSKESTTTQEVETETESEGQVASASAEGFAGPVFVEVMIGSDNAIQAIQIGDDNFAETKGFGASAKEPEFMNQFIGKTLPIAIEDIDALSGATITTKAVISAINEAYEGLEEKAKEANPEGRTISATAEGFAGPVFVEIVLDDDDIILSIRIGDESFAETKGFGANATEPAFFEQFVGKKLPITIDDIDALSGATITTKAVLAAIEAAYQELQE